MPRSSSVALRRLWLSLMKGLGQEGLRFSMKGLLPTMALRRLWDKVELDLIQLQIRSLQMMPPLFMPRAVGLAMPRAAA